jgi:predicted nucleotidyltransferase
MIAARQPDEQASFFSGEIRRRLGARAHKIVLFGSRARGDAHEWSDYDFLVVVDQYDDSLREIISDIDVSFLDRFNKIACSLLYTAGQWARRIDTPLGINISREGITL